jgi:DNA repair protein SbcD/Mre11
MKTAITSDLHLTSLEQHPQRFRAFKNILDQLLAMRIDNLIVAGDLFDASLHNYAEFDSLCQQEKYRHMHLHIIPGNHDAGISNRHILAANAKIYSQTTYTHWDPQLPGFLFVPYQADKVMGEAIAEFVDEISAQKWILIGHGDWSEGLFQANPYEGGVYMPLSRKDLVRFNPQFVFLGHIHVPYHKENVYYPGSPCGLNISETGRRRFLVFDSSTDQVSSIPVSSEVIYFDETVVVLPVEEEGIFLRRKVEAMITAWGLLDDELEKACLRIKVKGASANKAALAQTLQEALKGINLYSQPDLAEVSIAEDPSRSHIVASVRKQVEEFDWRQHPDEPEKDDLLIEALAIVYGR